MKGKIKKEILLIGILLFAIMLTLSFEASTRLEGPELCSSCHEMAPYYSSYINPQKGSLIANHKLNCIQCHSNKSIYEAKKNVAMEIIFHKLVSDSLSSPASELKVNCTKCHFTPANFMHQSMNLTTCTECHWAHMKTKQNISSSIVPVGPHRNQSCQNCHGDTFQIPRCINCHTGHKEEKLDNNLCLGCHLDPHVPKKPGILPNNTVKFTGNLSFEACQPCHEQQYYELINGNSLHTAMQTCTKCHNSHGKKPECSKCHRGMMIERHKNFRCETCHKTFNPVKVTCHDCHNNAHDPLNAKFNPK